MRVEALHLKGFPQGLNREADPYLLSETEVPNAVNVDFGPRGEITRRKGYGRIDEPLEVTSMQRILTWRSDDNEFLLALGGTDRKVWIGSMLYE